MGRLFRRAMVIVKPGAICNSACALIVFASRAHFGEGQLGLHRPSYRAEYFAGLSFEEARGKTRDLAATVRSYLKEMGVPSDLVDQMMTVPSNDVFYLNMDDYRARAGAAPAAAFEWLKARCGALSPAEMLDLVSAMAYIHYEAAMSMPDGERLVSEDDRKKARLGAALSSGYRNYLLKRWREVSACEEAEIRAEQRRILQSLPPVGLFDDILQSE